MVRTPEFKKWFGDWERLAHIAEFEKMPVFSVDTSVIPLSTDIKEFKRNAHNYGRTIAGKYTNKTDGMELVLTTSSKLGGLKEILQHDYKDEWHIKSIAAIPYIAQNMVFINSEKNTDPQKHPEISEFRYYLSKIRIDGKDYVVKSVVSLAQDGKRYYDHKLTPLSKISELKSLSVIQKTDWENSPSTIKDKRLIKILQEVNAADVSKVIDENGEPLVVWHITNNEFDVFNTAEGAFFTSDMDYIEEYAKEKGYKNAPLALFLNIRSPKNAGSTGANPTLEAPIIRQAQAEGMDGIIFAPANEYDSKSYVAFYPNQIKSATDNAGTFDANNPSILYSLDDENADNGGMGTNTNSKPKSNNTATLTVTELKNFIDESLENRNDLHKRIIIGKIDNDAQQRIRVAYGKELNIENINIDNQSVIHAVTKKAHNLEPEDLLLAADVINTAMDIQKSDRKHSKNDVLIFNSGYHVDTGYMDEVG